MSNDQQVTYGEAIGVVVTLADLVVSMDAHLPRSPTTQERTCQELPPRTR